MNILDKEKLNNIQYELEQDEELIHEYEKNQMQHDILYELNNGNWIMKTEGKKEQQRTNLFYNKCNWIMKTEGKKDNNERIVLQRRQLDNENRS